MFELLKRRRRLGSSQFTPAPLTLESRVKGEVGRVMRRSRHEIRNTMRLGRFAGEIRDVCLQSFGQTIHTTSTMTVGELINQLKEK